MKNEIDLDAVMKQMAAEHEPRLAGPGAIWVRAEMLRKAKEQERIERPMEVMRLLAAITGAMVLIVLLSGNWGQIQVAMKDTGRFMLLALVVAVGALLASAVVLLRSPAKR
jgi:hypothetical protein